MVEPGAIVQYVSLFRDSPSEVYHQGGLPTQSDSMTKPADAEPCRRVPISFMMHQNSARTLAYALYAPIARLRLRAYDHRRWAWPHGQVITINIGSSAQHEVRH